MDNIGIDIVNKVDILKKTMKEYKGILVDIDATVFFNADKVMVTGEHLEFYTKEQLKAEVVIEKVKDKNIDIEVQGSYINIDIGEC